MKTTSSIGKAAAVSLLCAALLSACSTNTKTDSTAEATTTAKAGQTAGTATTANGTTSTASALTVTKADLTKAVTYDSDDTNTSWSADSSTAIQLNGSSATVTGSGASSKDGDVTITKAGTYVISGKLTNGQVFVNVEGDGLVHLVLNGAEITNADSAAIFVQSAEKAVITLQEGTTNSVTDAKTYVYPDSETDEPKAAIYSKDDLTFNGTGSLTVTGNYNDGITGKDDLKFVSGTFSIQAADDGIVGKDMVAVQDGTFTIKSEGDGIKSTNDTDTDKGFIVLAGGTYTIEAKNDGIQAETSLLIEDGTYNLLTGGGYTNAEPKTEERGPGGFGMGQPGGRGQGNGQENGTNQAPQATASAEPTTSPETTPASTDTDATETESTSAKGVKAGGGLYVTGGTFTINSADDALHSNNTVDISNGTFTIDTGDDGVHGDSVLAISGGTITIKNSYEGLEAADITISGGEIHVTASDDGVNAAGNDGTNNKLTVQGGYLYVDAGGDGLDSNGSIIMTGGTVLVNGPTNDGNGPLDYDATFELSGGTLVAAGSSGMAQATSDSSSQAAILMTYPSSQQAGTLVQLQDSSGKALLTFAPTKAYQSIVISTPELKSGASYTLYSGGTSSGTAKDGLYSDGTTQGSTKVVAFDTSSSVTWLNESGVTTAKAGFGGGGRGDNPPSGERPQGGPNMGGGTPPEGAPDGNGPMGNGENPPTATASPSGT